LFTKFYFRFETSQITQNRGGNQIRHRVGYERAIWNGPLRTEYGRLYHGYNYKFVVKY
jgi:hypothetical protein